MRNDIKKIDNITKEMEVNNKLYYEMLDDVYENVLNFFYAGEDEKVIETFETLYFKRRILSVMEKNDLPFKAAIGLFCHKNCMDLICKYRDAYIEDEDSDLDIYNYIIDLGYRFYQSIWYLGADDYEVYEEIKHRRKIEEEKLSDLLNNRSHS